MLRRTTTLLILPMAVVALAACGGGEKTIDTGAVESKLLDAQKEKTPDLEVSDARCPDDVEAEEGATFECTVAIAGVRAPFKVEVTDASGDEGSFELEPARPIIGVAKAIELIRSQLDPDEGEIDVDCGPDEVKVLDVGDSFDCTVEQSGDRATVHVTVKDEEGLIELST